MTVTGRWLLGIYAVVAATLMTVGVAGLLSRRMDWHIPLVTTEIIPALHRHAVWGETLRGRAVLVSGEDWFFLIVVGLVILLGLFLAGIHRLIRLLLSTGEKKPLIPK